MMPCYWLSKRKRARQRRHLRKQRREKEMMREEKRNDSNKIMMQLWRHQSSQLKSQMTRSIQAVNHRVSLNHRSKSSKKKRNLSRTKPLSQMTMRSLNSKLLSLQQRRMLEKHPMISKLHRLSSVKPTKRTSCFSDLTPSKELPTREPCRSKSSLSQRCTSSRLLSTRLLQPRS